MTSAELKRKTQVMTISNNRLEEPSFCVELWKRTESYQAAQSVLYNLRGLEPEATERILDKVSNALCGIREELEQLSPLEAERAARIIERAVRESTCDEDELDDALKERTPEED